MLSARDSLKKLVLKTTKMTATYLLMGCMDTWVGSGSSVGAVWVTALMHIDSPDFIGKPFLPISQAEAEAHSYGFQLNLAGQISGQLLLEV